MNVSLDGKVAIVTGAASGIGKAIVRAYLDSNAAGVVAVDVADRPVEWDAVPEQDARRLRFVKGDIAADDTARRFTDEAIGAFGQIDILVNNAGISVVKPIHEHTPEEWDRVFDVNVKAIYFAARHVIPHMLRAGAGVVLNTGSISGAVGIPTQGAYGPSKGAIHLLTRQMAVEYAPRGIRVNAICCGTVDTPIVHRSAQASGDPERYWAMLKDNHPIGRIASPQEVAAFFVYMASDLASFFTGSLLMMDGGYTAR